MELVRKNTTTSVLNSLKYDYQKILIRMNNYIIVLIRMNNYIKNTNEDELYQIQSHSTWHIMADMICMHKVYELLMSILVCSDNQSTCRGMNKYT